MKNVVRISFLFILAFSFIQCEKDDDSVPETKNSIKMDGRDFDVTSASMAGVSIGDDGHTGITFMSGNSEQGDALIIDVESFTKETIQGDYAYPIETDKKWLDNWLTSYTVYNSSSMNTSNLESGQVTIISNGGNNFTVDMDLTMDDGVTFVGEYTGEFQVLFSNQDIPEF